MKSKLATIMLAVVSADGFIARLDQPGTAWASAADQVFFKDMLSHHGLFIMGSTTYEAVRPPKPREGLLRVVMTHQPADYDGEAVRGKLEFTDQSATELVVSLADRGYDQALILGGGHIFAEFWQAELINDAYITYEPVKLGSGVPLFHNLTVDFSQFSIIERKKLNDEGTELVHYKIA